jgi:hypothetical protein
MPSDEPKSKLALTIYLPTALRQQVVREAKEDRRTLSSLVEIALTEHFKTRVAAQ